MTNQDIFILMQALEKYGINSNKIEHIVIDVINNKAVQRAEKQASLCIDRYNNLKGASYAD